jgi:hypothetical protein
LSCFITPFVLCRAEMKLSLLSLEFRLRPGNRERLYAAASCLSSSVAIALINCGN